MYCPECIEPTKVIDSRDHRDLNVIRRRRECVECGYRFTTYESIIGEGPVHESGFNNGVDSTVADQANK